MIGVSYGAPTEFRFRQAMVPEDRLPKWKPDMVSNGAHQDDLYAYMTLAKVLDDKGLDATTEDFGAMFKDAKDRLWHANPAARRAPQARSAGDALATLKYNAHANDIDFQIEVRFYWFDGAGHAAIGGQTPCAAAGDERRRRHHRRHECRFPECMRRDFSREPPQNGRGGPGRLPPKSPYAR